MRWSLPIPKKDESGPVILPCSFKVLKEGQVQVGDKIEIIRKDKNNVTVKDIVHLYITRDHAVDNFETMRRAIKISALPEGWKYEFQQNIEQLERRSQNSYYCY